MKTAKLPSKKVIVNRLEGYIRRIESEKLKREALDTLYILKRILEP